MTKKKASKKHNPRSEAAMREAVRVMSDSRGRLIPTTTYCFTKPWILRVYHLETENLLAIFDLRDCYRKRAPLKGVAKELKKVMTKRR